MYRRNKRRYYNNYGDYYGGPSEQSFYHPINVAPPPPLPPIYLPNEQDVFDYAHEQLKYLSTLNMKSKKDKHRELLINLISPNITACLILACLYESMIIYQPKSKVFIKVDQMLRELVQQDSELKYMIHSELYFVKNKTSKVLARIRAKSILYILYDFLDPDSDLDFDDTIIHKKLFPKFISYFKRFKYPKTTKPFPGVEQFYKPSGTQGYSGYFGEGEDETTSDNGIDRIDGITLDNDDFFLQKLGDNPSAPKYPNASLFFEALFREPLIMQKFLDQIGVPYNKEEFLFIKDRINSDDDYAKTNGSRETFSQSIDSSRYMYAINYYNFICNLIYAIYPKYSQVLISLLQSHDPEMYQAVPEQPISQPYSDIDAVSDPYTPTEDTYTPGPELPGSPDGRLPGDPGGGIPPYEEYKTDYKPFLISIGAVIVIVGLILIVMKAMKFKYSYKASWGR